LFRWFSFTKCTNLKAPGWLIIINFVLELDWAGPIHAQRKPSPPRTTAQIPHDLLISHLPLSRSGAFLLRTCLIERVDGGMSDRGAFPALHSGTGAWTAADGANGEGGSRWGRMGLAVESAAADATGRWLHCPIGSGSTSPRRG